MMALGSRLKANYSVSHKHSILGLLIQKEGDVARNLNFG